MKNTTRALQQKHALTLRKSAADCKNKQIRKIKKRKAKQLRCGLFILVQRFLGFFLD